MSFYSGSEDSDVGLLSLIPKNFMAELGYGLETRAERRSNFIESMDKKWINEMCNHLGYVGSNISSKIFDNSKFLKRIAERQFHFAISRLCLFDSFVGRDFSHAMKNLVKILIHDSGVSKITLRMWITHTYEKIRNTSTTCNLIHEEIIRAL